MDQLSLLNRLRLLEAETKPVNAEVAAALKRRWTELPERSQVPAQMVGRRSAGCEGTHGVFPQCDFGCRPCYHSSDANMVRIDGPHTVSSVESQMEFARKERGPGQYAQLIGGEVSLLDPDDHALALLAMHEHDRNPMSFSHGDFDYDYLEKLALGPDGEKRFDHLAFAIHIDTTMIGRRSVQRPKLESELDEERTRVAKMFKRLEDNHGVTSYLAHNMTVTPENLDQVPDVIRMCRRLGYRMFSFQPAAYIGHENRWEPDYRDFGDDDVWQRIEDGAGTRLPYDAVHFGDVRCNRLTWGAFIGDRYVPVLDDRDEEDMAFRDQFFDTFPGTLGYGSPSKRIMRVIRSLANNPAFVLAGLRWALRFKNRAGGLSRELLSINPTTFVMHRFMDSADVAAAWQHMANGTKLTEPRLVETTERLQACAYSMPHPETNQMVPACVQHGVLDPGENEALMNLLPRVRSAKK